jgi:hypothetical protein
MVVQLHWTEEEELHQGGVLHVVGDEDGKVFVVVENACQNGNAVYFDRDSHSELVQAAKFVAAEK